MFFKRLPADQSTELWEGSHFPQSTAAQMATVPQNASKGSADQPSAENGNNATANAKEDEWDEEKLEKAMQTLKEMHIQVTPQ